MKKSSLWLGIAVALFYFTPLYAQTAQDYVHLGNVAGRDIKYKEAIKDYTKAIEEDPNLANAYYNRGYIYLELRKYKQSLADLDLAIGIDNNYAAAYHLRGVIYFYRKKYKEAIYEYDKALKIDPDNVRYHISRLSALFKIGSSDGAWEEVIQIQKLGGTVNPAIVNILKARNYRE